MSENSDVNQSLKDMHTMWLNLRSEIQKLKDFQFVETTKYVNIEKIIDVGDKAFSGDKVSLSEVRNNIAKWLQERDNLTDTSRFFSLLELTKYFGQINNVQSDLIGPFYQQLSTFNKFLEETANSSNRSTNTYWLLNSFMMEFARLKDKILKEKVEYDNFDLSIKKIDDFIFGYQQYLYFIKLEKDLTKEAMLFFCSQAYNYYLSVQ